MLLLAGVTSGEREMVQRSISVVRCIVIALSGLIFTPFAISLPVPAEAQVAKSCQKFVGSWSWPSALVQGIEIKSDGTVDAHCAVCSGGVSWSCTGNQIEITGLLGSGAKFTLSADGKQLSGTTSSIAGLMSQSITLTRKSALPASTIASSPASKSTADKPALISVGTTPAQAEKLLELPRDVAPRGIYKLDQEYDFNVLDEVYYDASTRQISLIGHHDERFKGPRIPYLQHLATLLEVAKPEFTLNMTPESPSDRHIF